MPNFKVLAAIVTSAGVRQTNTASKLQRIYKGKSKKGHNSVKKIKIQKFEKVLFR